MRNADELIDEMSQDLGLLPRHLREIIRTAPLRYKVFWIAKKSGGLREVAQPAREVKAIQRWLLRVLASSLPIHPSATAYGKGDSIAKNAEAHLGSRYLLKLDFSNFFPSITMEDLILHFSHHLRDSLDGTAARLIAYSCVWARNRERPLRLCIGAPSSPLLSNSVMHSFDELLHVRARSDGVNYTRYADDITLSSPDPGILGTYPDFIEEMLRGLSYPRLKINQKKTIHVSKAHLRVVTGITLTPDDKLSIGRARKRQIRAMYHRMITSGLSPELTQKLNGLLAFAEDVEPGFRSRLIKAR